MAAPELHVSQWFNTDRDITLASLRGKVVVVEAFQMLCPGCVSQGLPLAQKVHQSFPREVVAVLGLHTVFEHHAAMTPVSLKAFLHEYRITFPVGVDTPGVGPLPKTMEAFQMRGTPSMLIFDKSGALRAHHFGAVPELLLGAEIATLLCEDADPAPGAAMEIG
ncbi:peroxiredoxin family protein [Maliponia aquimaris]|uniref:Thiol-disulfide oxidoreductase n=1 Tax=Maliponia aquimaris TaxID=1673631 RepID=A0A238L1Q7_9RHOB|nr:redoxin domain-containing protein [Maliponia aquimaris]SMX48800.1 thiol-disulfide oxidoreductase [Maliponia aquimaris]